MKNYSAAPLLSFLALCLLGCSDLFDISATDTADQRDEKRSAAEAQAQIDRIRADAETEIEQNRALALEYVRAVRDENDARIKNEKSRAAAALSAEREMLLPGRIWYAAALTSFLLGCLAGMISRAPVYGIGGASVAVVLVSIVQTVNTWPWLLPVCVCICAGSMTIAIVVAVIRTIALRRTDRGLGIVARRVECGGSAGEEIKLDIKSHPEEAALLETLIRPHLRGIDGEPKP